MSTVYGQHESCSTQREDLSWRAKRAASWGRCFGQGRADNYGGGDPGVDPRGAVEVDSGETGRAATRFG